MTRRREAEAGARRAQRTEAAGQLTGGVAHGCNDLLTVIGGNLGFVERAAREEAAVARGSP